jgi:hypothetical protein
MPYFEFLNECPLILELHIIIQMVLRQLLQHIYMGHPGVVLVGQFIGSLTFFRYLLQLRVLLLHMLVYE